MKVAVKDANVFIDLEISGLLELWFQLEIETHTTVFIREELRVGGHQQALSHFDSGTVKTHSLDFTEILVVETLMGEVKRAASFNDCSVLWLAEKLDAPLLSGDGALRKSAEKRGVDVRGTLWIFDELVRSGLLVPGAAAAKLRLLQSANTFLPVDACNERLKAWEELQ